MSQQRLCTLATIFIEKDTVNRLNCSDVIKDFVSKKKSVKPIVLKTDDVTVKRLCMHDDD